MLKIKRSISVIHIKTMYWLLVILTAVGCAPVVKDPVDIVLHTKNSNFVSYNVEQAENSESKLSTEDYLERIIELLKETTGNYETVEDSNHERHKNGGYTIYGELLDIFENYQVIKEKEQNEAFDSAEVQAINDELLDILGEITTDSKADVLNALYDFIDDNIGNILQELITKLKNEAIESPKPTKPWDGKGWTNQHVPDAISAHYDIIKGDNRPIPSEDDSRNRRIEHDAAKEAPLMDVKVNVKTNDFTSQNYNLKVLYEKHGGVCTLIRGYSNNPIYVISKCPLGTPHSVVRELCESAAPLPIQIDSNNAIDITKTPVQDAEGFVYRNLYCAQCNGVNGMQAWITKVDCENQHSLSISDGTNKVTVLEHVKDSSEVCHRRLTPAIKKMIHECGQLDVVTSLNQWYHQPRVSDGAKSDVSPFPLSFSILMNFGFDGKTHILFSTTSSQSQTYSYQCGQNEKYDPLHDKCRPIVCSQGYKLVDGTCQKMMNYEVDTNPDDLSGLVDIDEPVQVTLTIRNITFGDLIMLNITGIEDILRATLASQFNISLERIQNLTVSLLNSTDLGNRTGNSIIEISRFTTPLPVKMLMKHYPSKKVGHIKTITKTVFHGRPPSSKNNQSQPFVVYASENASEDTSSESNEGKKSKFKILKNEVPKKENYEHNNDDDSDENKDDNAPETTVKWNSHIGRSLKIGFILKPAHKSKDAVEKSVNSVVQNMNYLLQSNTFMLTINGTDYQVGDFENAPIDLFCQKGSHPLITDTEFYLKTVYDPRVDQNVTVIKVNATGNTYYPGEYDLTLNIDGSVGVLEETLVTKFAFVCNMPKIVDDICGRIALNRNEYELFKNMSIKFAEHLYDTTQYEYDNETSGTVTICSPDWLSTEAVHEENTVTMACGDGLIKLVIAESYLTFILGVISLVCMLSVLVTYGIFEKLRNLPGINTMNLTLSLFLGELLFIVSGWIKPHQEWLCSVFGVILHFFFLASFFWMNVMSYDVFKTFAHKSILRRIRNKKKYVPRYSLYAWGTPLVIVSLCCLFDFGDIVDGIDIGYGGSGIKLPDSSDLFNGDSGDLNSTLTNPDKHGYHIGCWIQSPVASMAAFGGPMLLVLIGNTFMFSRTILSIRACTKATKTSIRKTSMHQMSGKQDVMLYIRMSTVMGFTWIFGLASSFVSAFAGPASEAICIVLHLLGILFIVFNCSQGIFIFFAFVCNRRVLALYKALFKKRQGRDDRSVSVSSSRNTLTTNVSQTSFEPATITHL